MRTSPVIPLMNDRSKTHGICARLIRGTDTADSSIALGRGNKEEIILLVAGYLGLEVACGRGVVKPGERRRHSSSVELVTASS